jgi:hypothetical protein
MFFFFLFLFFFLLDLSLFSSLRFFAFFSSIFLSLLFIYASVKSSRSLGKWNTSGDDVFTCGVSSWSAPYRAPLASMLGSLISDFTLFFCYLIGGVRSYLFLPIFPKYFRCLDRYRSMSMFTGSFMSFIMALVCCISLLAFSC